MRTANEIASSPTCGKCKCGWTLPAKGMVITMMEHTETMYIVCPYCNTAYRTTNDPAEWEVA